MSRTLPYISYEATRALEEETGVKHEWWSGRAIAMAGGTLRHASIAGRLLFEFTGALGDGPCIPYSSGARIRSIETDVLTYADLSVICGLPEYHPGDSTAASNPTVIVEVLSPTTEAYDRGDKLRHYMGITSVRHILLVTVHTPRIEHYQRTDLGWLYTDHEAGDSVHLLAIDVDLSVDRVYRGLHADPVERKA